MNTKLGGLLIHTENPESVRDWYAKAFDAAVDGRGQIGDNGFGLGMGEDQYFIFFPHDEVSGRAKEPARIIVNIAVDDADSVAARLDGLGARWIRPLEDGGPGRIATVADPDGNYVQIVQIIEGEHRPV